jgi:hypothetical protein
MVRSAAAVLAVLILPTFVLGQEPQETHDVVTDIGRIAFLDLASDNSVMGEQPA